VRQRHLSTRRTKRTKRKSVVTRLLMPHSPLILNPKRKRESINQRSTMMSLLRSQNQSKRYQRLRPKSPRRRRRTKRRNTTTKR
jgi:hypothetical protein